jgi:tripartite-type tricarboxylate transporter receptor subunit TctC
MLHLLWLLVAASAPGLTAAQDYPAKPVRLIAASSPGSGPDVISRLLAQKLTERLGQQVIVENRPGGIGSSIGSEYAARAAPDAYTLLMVTASQPISLAMYKKLPYDLVRDFAPVSLVASTPHIFVVHPSVPATTVKAFVTLAKSRPGEMLLASGGIGTPTHLAGEMLKEAAKINFVHVAYKGMGPAIADLLAGHAHFSFAVAPISLPYVSTGRMRALAVADSRRSTLAPEVPTMAEAGIPLEAVGWYGIVAPAGTPAALVSRLNREIQAIVSAPDMTKRLNAAGTEPITNSTPASFGAFLGAEIRKWAKVVIDSGVKIE